MPGGPIHSTPRGILPPRRWNFCGSRRNSTISCRSSLASSMPATSAKGDARVLRRPRGGRASGRRRTARRCRRPCCSWRCGSSQRDADEDGTGRSAHIRLPSRLGRGGGDRRDVERLLRRQHRESVRVLRSVGPRSARRPCARPRSPESLDAHGAHLPALHRLEEGRVGHRLGARARLGDECASHDGDHRHHETPSHPGEGVERRLVMRRDSCGGGSESDIAIAGATAEGPSDSGS